MKPIYQITIFLALIAFLFIQRCQITKLKETKANQKKEVLRAQNNLFAAKNKLKQWQLNENTWISEKAGYTLTIDELKKEYSNLMLEYKISKNKKPITLIKTEYIIKDSIIKIPLTINNENITFRDSLYFGNNNFRVLSGRIPFKLDTSGLKVENGIFDLRQGINIKTGLFKDKKTNKISIIVETDYPGLTFTHIEGAYIDENILKKENKKKPFSFGLSAGYGYIIGQNPSFAPYFGVGLNYNPKWLQFGR